MDTKSYHVDLNWPEWCCDPGEAYSKIAQAVVDLRKEVYLEYLNALESILGKLGANHNDLESRQHADYASDQIGEQKDRGDGFVREDETKYRAPAQDPDQVDAGKDDRSNNRQSARYHCPDAWGKDRYVSGCLVVIQDELGLQVEDTREGKMYRVQLIRGRYVGSCNCGMTRGKSKSFQCPHQAAARALIFNRWWFGKPPTRRWRGIY